MASRSTSAAQSNVQKSLDKAVNAKDGPAGLVFASIDRKGNVLAAAAAGLKSLDNKNDPVGGRRYCKSIFDGSCANRFPLIQVRDPRSPQTFHDKKH